MKPKTTYNGVSVTRQYLSVWFRLEFAHSVRFCCVRIPIRALESETFVDAMQLAQSQADARRRSEVDAQVIPLF